MTDKKKKPVESALKEDLDKAINEAAVAVVAENITTKAVEKLTEGKKKLPAVAEKVLKEAKKKIADFESDDTSFDARPGFKFKRQQPEDFIKLEPETVELSQIWDENILTQDRLGAIVTIGSKSLMPIGEPIKSSSLGNGRASVVPDITWKVKSALNKLETSVDLYRYAFRLANYTVVLYLSEDSIYSIDEEFYGFHGEPSQAVLIGISSTFRNVTAKKGSIAVKYDVEKSHLCEAVLINIDPKLEKRYRGYESRPPETEYWCNNNWSENRRYGCKLATVNDSEIINSDIEYGQFTNSYVNRCVLESGSHSISVYRSRLETLEVIATKRIYLSDSTLSGRISCAATASIQGLKANDLFISDSPEGVDITSQFGWVRVDWMNDTSIRFFTGENGKLVISIPYQFAADHNKQWVVLDIFWEDFELNKDRLNDYRFNINRNQLNMTNHLTFRNNGRVVERPDMIQRSFVEYLEAAIESRLRVLALIRSVSANAQAVAPRRPGYYDEVPF